MTTRLASLLVQDGVVSAERMTEAFERQVILEGPLDTVLLEMREVDEGVLVDYLARASGLAPMVSLPTKDVALLARVVTPSLSEHYRVVPVAREGAVVQVLAMLDVNRHQLDRLATLLGVTLDVRVAPEVRFFEAREQVYGVPMSDRLAALTAKLRMQRRNVPAVLPAESAPVPVAPVQETTQKMAAHEVVAILPQTEAVAAAVPQAEVVASALPQVEVVVAVLPQTEIAAVAVPQTVEAVPIIVAQAEDTARMIVVESEDEAPAAPASMEEEERTERESLPPAPIPLLAPETTAVVETGEVIAPLGFDEGMRALDEAQERDQVFAILCRMGRTRFSFAALFGIHGSEAQVHMALGERWLERHGVSCITIKLDHPCSLVATVRTRAPYLGHPGATPPMTEALARMGREPTVWGVLLPVVLRDRTVAVLYGDAGGCELDVQSLSELVQGTVKAAQALQRIILRSKVGRTTLAKPKPVPKATPVEPTVRITLASPPRFTDLTQQIFDSDLTVRRTALAHLTRLAPSRELADLLNHLRSELTESEETHLRYAAEALGELRDIDAVAPLIELVRHADQLVSISARRALVTITKQDFGASRWLWRSWWHNNRTRSRVEWLVDALNHASGELCQAAVDELENILSDERVYHAMLPRQERELGRRRFLAWQQNH